MGSVWGSELYEALCGVIVSSWLASNLKSMSPLIFLVLLQCGLGTVQSKLEKPSCVNDTCAGCYHLLVYNLLTSDTNQYNMQRAFFPPRTASPVVVTVTYQFRNNMTEGNNTKVWFWTASAFYHFQPLQILQYTSLFFSDLKSRTQEVELTLDSECAGANDDYMRLLTQRVSTISVTVKIVSLKKCVKFTTVDFCCKSVLRKLMRGPLKNVFPGQSSLQLQTRVA